jgi:hypothetical protein
MSAILTSLVDELSSSGSWLCLHGLHCRARIIRIPIVVWPRAFCPFGSARCRNDRMRANSRNTHSTYSIDSATMCAPPEEFLKRGVKPALIRDVRLTLERRICAIYSMTSSARESSEGGTANPSALAALRLMTSSNLVGCWTGRSEVFSPLRIRAVRMPP